MAILPQDDPMLQALATFELILHPAQRPDGTQGMACWHADRILFIPTGGTTIQWFEDPCAVAVRDPLPMDEAIPLLRSVWLPALWHVAQDAA